MSETSETATFWPALSVAVIIPLYNGARHIEAALLSVVRQTRPAAEIIVVDDGSTDGGKGAAIVRRLAQTHPIRLLSRPNGGQSAARNWGLAHTGCDLIAFLDHDDIWYENHLAELVKPFRRTAFPPLGWVYSDLDEVDEAGLMVCRSYLRTMATVHPKRTVFDCIGQDMFILPSAALISRAAFETVGGFDESLCGYEDDDLFLRLFRAGYSHMFIEQPLSQWRIHPHSTSYSPRMTDSRRLYVGKLVAAFPDDTRRARYYLRDLIVPRFLGHELRDYGKALKAGDLSASETAWSQLRLFAHYSEALGPALFEPALDRHRHAVERGDHAGACLAWTELEALTQNGERYAPTLAAYVLQDYKRALSVGSPAAIAGAWQKLAAIAQRTHAKRLCLVLALLRRPAVARAAFAVRRLARPVMLWAFRIDGARPRLGQS